MRSLWMGIALAALAITTPGKVFAGLEYAPEDAVRYTLAGSLGKGQEGPAASVNLGFHFGHLLVGAMAFPWIPPIARRNLGINAVCDLKSGNDTHGAFH